MIHYFIKFKQELGTDLKDLDIEEIIEINNDELKHGQLVKTTYESRELYNIPVDKIEEIHPHDTYFTKNRTVVGWVIKFEQDPAASQVIVVEVKDVIAQPEKLFGGGGWANYKHKILCDKKNPVWKE